MSKLMPKQIAFTAANQVIVSGAGPTFLGTRIAATSIPIPANTGYNVSASTLQDWLEELAAERVFTHVASTNPTANNDGVDTAALGVIFKVGDQWVNTATSAVYVVTSIATSNAVWRRSDIASLGDVFEYKGALNASSGTLPSSPEAGDYYRISVSGTFSGAFTPALNVDDAIVYNGTSWDRIDNTDPTVTVAGTDPVTISGDTTVGYTLSFNGWTALANDAILFRQNSTTVSGVAATAGSQYLRRNDADTAYEFVTLSIGNHAIGEATYSGATQSVSHSFTSFFTGTPVAGTVNVFFNGLRIANSGWSSSATTLTLDLSALTYPLETGDVIAASYEY